MYSGGKMSEQSIDRQNTIIEYIQSADRLSCTEKVKLSTGQYESYEFSFTYSSDRRPQENIDDASKRVLTIVEQQIKERVIRVRSKTKEKQHVR